MNLQVHISDLSSASLQVVMNPPRICPHCGDLLGDRFKLYRHMIDMHNKRFCLFCDLEEGRVERLKKHITKKHPTVCLEALEGLCSDRNQTPSVMYPPTVQAHPLLANTPIPLPNPAARPLNRLPRLLLPSLPHPITPLTNQKRLKLHGNMSPLQPRVRRLAHLTSWLLQNGRFWKNWRPHCQISSRVQKRHPPSPQSQLPLTVPWMRSHIIKLRTSLRKLWLSSLTILHHALLWTLPRKHVCLRI